MMTVTFTGNHPFRRYLLKNGDRFWTLDGWRHDPTEAILYRDIQEAWSQLDEIALLEVEGQKVRQFTMPIVINVQGDAPFTEDDLAEYLKNACRISFDYEAHGRGPKGNVIHISGIWSDVQEI